ncbi:MAG TPA: hypothetical protein VGB99_02975 [Acidobacteriota bacterium]
MTASDGWNVGHHAAAALALLLGSAAPLGAAGPVGPQFRVNSFTLGTQSGAEISQDDAGNFVVVWIDNVQDSSGSGVFGQRFDSSGMSQGAEFQVNSETATDQSSAAVAHDPAGKFVVVWHSYFQDGDLLGIFGQRYDSLGMKLGGEFQINSVTANQQRIPDVSCDTAGNLVVVWESAQDGDSLGIFGQRFDSLGLKLGGEFQINSHTTAGQRRPAIAHDASSGSFVVVWNSENQDGSDNGIFGQRFDSMGGALGAEFQVNSHTISSQYDKDVAMDAAGNFMVVWQSAYQDGGGLWGIFGQRFDSLGGMSGAEFQINSYTTSIQIQPAVARDAAGNFVVAWGSLDQDGDGLGIFAQQFDSIGAPHGGELQVNTFTPGTQFYPAASGGPSGSFLIVWSSYLDADSDYDVWAQRFGLVIATGPAGGGASKVRVLE